MPADAGLRSNPKGNLNRASEPRALQPSEKRAAALFSCWQVGRRTAHRVSSKSGTSVSDVLFMAEFGHVRPRRGFYDVDGQTVTIVAVLHKRETETFYRKE